MVNNRPIGFFDSGVGLFSTLVETKKLLPNENFVIFADQSHNPYGEKSGHQIRKFARTATEFLIIKHNIKMMVLACNTATVLALDYLRKNFDIPIVGTVPAVKPAFEGHKQVRVAIMSTPATAKSKYLDSLINDFGEPTKTLKVGCTGLEEAIEVWDHTAIETCLDQYIKKINSAGPNVVVLGCTHYPLIRDLIRKKLDKKVQIIDSGRAIAQRIKNILAEKRLSAKRKTPDFYYTTGDPRLFSKVSSMILKKPVIAQKA